MPRKSLVAFALCCLSLSVIVHASPRDPRERSATPHVLKFSASLSSDPMARFEPGLVSVTFAIYKEQDDETPLWIRTQNVTIDEYGRFTVLLGEAEENALPLDLFTSGEARWLGIQRVPERERDRIMLASVPYALKAVDAETLGGRPLSAFVMNAQSDTSDAKSKLKPRETGSAGFLPKFIDTTNIDNSILFESSGKIGLSTTSPQGPLHINSVMTYRGAGVGSIQSGLNPGVLLEDPGTNSTVLLSENFGLVVYVRNSATTPLTGSDQRLVVRPSGNVGIGINNPQAPLHISGTGNYRNLNVATVHSGTNPGLMMENPGTNSTVAFTENNGLAIYAKPSATQTFSGSDLRLFMTPLGDVGIGIGMAMPTQKLDVGGGINLNGNVLMPASTFFGGNIFLGGTRFMHAFGSGNTFLGESAGNQGLTSQANTGIGYHSLMSLTNGGGNTAIGQLTMVINNMGHDNTAVGAGSLNSNLTGNFNTAVGTATMASNSLGSDNVAVGKSSMTFNDTGGNNTAVGAETLNANTSGSYNFAGGYFALHNNSASGNTSVGALSMQANTIGAGNVAYGDSALYTNGTGNNNTAIGFSSLNANVSGFDNVAVGTNALINVTGNNNIGMGRDSGSALTTGTNNIDIGNAGVAAESNTIRIGSPGSLVRTFVAGIFNKTTDLMDAVPVVIASNGQLGTSSSSRRYKFDIDDMRDATDDLMRLRPVKFRYIKYGDGSRLQYGLIAEEVANVYPDLVARNADGEPETVMYQFLAPMLLNQVQKQQKTIDALNSTVEALAQRLKEVEAQLASSPRRAQ